MKMKKTIYAAIVAATVLATACDLETSDNGDLDGFWHLERVDTLDNGNYADLSSKKLFWAFQMHMMSVRDQGANKSSFWLRFNHKGDSLLVSDPYYNVRVPDDKKVEDTNVLAPFGISGLSDGYLVEKLNGSKMRLKSKTLRLYFTKF